MHTEAARGAQSGQDSCGLLQLSGLPVRGPSPAITCPSLPTAVLSVPVTSLPALPLARKVFLCYSNPWSVPLIGFTGHFAQ